MKSTNEWNPLFTKQSNSDLGLPLQSFCFRLVKQRWYHRFLDGLSVLFSSEDDASITHQVHVAIPLKSSKGQVSLAQSHFRFSARPVERSPKQTFPPVTEFGPEQESPDDHDFYQAPDHDSNSIHRAKTIPIEFLSYDKGSNSLHFYRGCNVYKVDLRTILPSGLPQNIGKVSVLPEGGDSARTTKKRSPKKEL